MVSTLLRRVAPALVLFVLTPLVAEYLLGDLLITQLAALPVLALLYGSGAVFIRELARRTGRGWPTILTLGLAYGLVEEGLATQSLFNPHYLGLRLLDYGFIPFLGIGAPWTVLVLSLHPVWSIGVPVALTELMFRSRRTTPWLGRTGLVWFGLLCALGMSMVGSYTSRQEHFAASPVQLALSALSALAAGVAAFSLFRPLRDPAAADSHAASPWLVGTTAFIAGSAFEALSKYAPEGKLIPAVVTVVAILALEAAVLVFIARSSRRAGWSDAHRFALAAGGLLVYCWWGFVIQAALHGPDGWPGHAILVGAALALLVSIGLRQRERAPSPAAGGVPSMDRI